MWRGRYGERLNEADAVLPLVYAAFSFNPADHQQGQATRSLALKQKAAIKAMSRQQKESMIFRRLPD